ncbi:hypothetical protein EUGRSUZ_H02518 [Eucalyptus grandis]|uniref:Protein kinase domain-containing protein n=2 Tax=Eucalyptus grandis TaxID=71139 RepID=A0A059B0K5_EUCGR|nr:hypothetical protein EUGRSUZ_H02518 [Eucalyptus grandis]
MALGNLLPGLLILLDYLATTALAYQVSIKETEMYPFNCSDQIKTCNAFLYHYDVGLQEDQIAAYYSVNPSQIKPIKHGNRRDYLISVPCSCQSAGNTTAYFHNTSYKVEQGDIFVNVSARVYSGQAWSVGDEAKNFIPNASVPMYLPCGCVKKDSQTVVTYTVQQDDTLTDIANLLSAELSSIQSMNPNLIQNSDSIGLGWVLFVPMENNGIPLPKKDIPIFESERPLIYSLEDIEIATSNFDETKKIGEGGYGSVYFGVLGEQEVAIKKMRSSKSKEFFAELKVLCKIHHINVVELLGYASGEDHLYLVYEYVQNGALSDHLHDPLLRGTEIQFVLYHVEQVADFGLAKFVGRSNEEDLIATQLVGTPGYLPPESVKELQVTPKADVFAFGVVLAELITGQRALIRDNQEPTKLKSLITVMNKIFRHKDPEAALEAVVDGTLRGSYPMEDMYKMAEIAEWCLSEDAVDRPEMREIVVTLSRILMSSTEWEASLGGNGQVFSGIFNGR